MSDQPIERWPRMNVIPSRSWARVEPIAASVSWVMLPVGPWASSVEVGGAGGSVQQNPAATR